MKTVSSQLAILKEIEENLQTVLSSQDDNMAGMAP